MAEKQFPNGFASWQETHFEIVSAIVIESRKNFPSGKTGEAIAQKGTGGLYELAEELTDKFELMHKDYQWDGEFFFFDTIEEFCQNEL